MRRKVTEQVARKELTELLESVESRGDEVVIERGGRPLAVVIPTGRYEALERSRDELRALIEKVRRANASDSPKEVDAGVRAAAREVRQARAKRTA
ncbi:MAG TPA: type II toxin-antitoxin system prevent-host-death family antitoxin [Tepidiformaceae bacterium]|nr:type II toxin-antitoxin system prevent-host-death family antitoxin [Tepidiformaceae bacterium]